MLVDREEERRCTDLLGVLDTRARYAVEQRFGLNDGRKRSYREVGEELGVTAEAARRLVKRAVDAVREEAERRASTPPDSRRRYIVGPDSPGRAGSRDRGFRCSRSEPARAAGRCFGRSATRRGCAIGQRAQPPGADQPGSRAAARLARRGRASTAVREARCRRCRRWCSRARPAR